MSKTTTEPKFQVGQTVRCKNNPLSKRRAGVGYRCGLEFKILSITDSNEGFIYWRGDTEGGVFEDALESLDWDE